MFTTFPENSPIDPPKRVKFGIDPTFDRLHLGHFVSIRLVRKLLAEGHDVTIVLGTATAQLGDPSGRDSTRPILDAEAVLQHANRIRHTLFWLLGPVNIFENGSLHNQTSVTTFLNEAASKFTLARMLSRNAFADRIERNHPIAIHELMVPLLQAMDSVHLRTEIEIGGQDQLFNFQVTRELQESFGQPPQVCLMVPIINGTDGRKMSKSLGNCIFLNESVNDIFGKIMSIPDTVMEEWYPLLSDQKPLEHPLDSKLQLAHDIVWQLCGLAAADEARQYFHRTVQQKLFPDELPRIQAAILLDAIKMIRGCSNTEARRLLAGGGVRVNGAVAEDHAIKLESGDVVQVGKREYAQIK